MRHTNYKIIMKNGQGKEDKEILVDQYEQEEIRRNLNKGKLIGLRNGMIINTNYVIRIEPIPAKEIISEKFLLPEPKSPRKFDKVTLEMLFNRMKLNGSFENYKNYQDWEKKHATK